MSKQEKRGKQEKQENTSKFNYADLDYDMVMEAMPDLPKSKIKYFFWKWKMFFKRLKPSKTLFKNLLKFIVFIIVFSVIKYYFNIFFWAWINDSMWIGWGRGFGYAAGYMIAGGAFTTGDTVRGIEPIAALIEWLSGTYTCSIPNGYLVFPFSLMVNMLGGYVIMQILSKGPISIFKDLAGVLVNLKKYRKKGSRKFWKFLVDGLFYAIVLGFLVVNPFAVFLLAIYILLCFGQGSSNARLLNLFLKRCCLYKETKDGKNEKPSFADVMLQAFSLGAGLLLYSLLNLMVWEVFNYHFFARLLFSALLGAMCIALSGKGFRRQMAKAASICFTAIGVMAFYKLTALAHDGGASESGGTWDGLKQNAGFSDMDQSSKVDALSNSAYFSILSDYLDTLRDGRWRDTEFTDTERFIRDKINELRNKYVEGEKITPEEFNAIRNMLLKYQNGQLSDDVNYQRGFWEGVWEDFKVAGANTIEELCRGQTPASVLCRIPLAIATNGVSEYVFTGGALAYDCYDRVNAGDPHAYGNVVFSNALNYAIGGVVGEATSGATSAAFRGMSNASNALQGAQNQISNWASNSSGTVSRTVTNFLQSMARSMEGSASYISQMGAYATASNSQSIRSLSRRISGHSNMSVENARLGNTERAAGHAAWSRFYADRAATAVMTETANSLASTEGSTAIGNALAPYSDVGTALNSGGASSAGASGGTSGGNSGTLWGARQQFADEFGF